MSVSLGVNGASYNYPQENDPAGWGDDSTDWASAVSAALSNIGLGGTVSADAVVNIISTSKGILIPRMTTAQRNAIGSPSTSLLIYNTTTTQYELYTGSTWQSLASYINGTLTVTGATSLQSTLNVTGGSTFANVTINGNETVNGTLTVTGTTSLASVTGTGLTVNGSTTLNGALTVTGATSLQSLSSLNVTGSTILSNVTGANITATGTILAASGTSGTPSISFSGDTDTGIWNSASNQLSVSIGGTTRYRIDSNGQQSSVIPDLSGSNTTLFSEFKCRAWINYKGTATRSIRGSGNVSSVTFNSTGNYTINFTTAMPDVNYSVVGSSDNASSAYPIKFFILTINVGSVQVSANRDTAGNMLDSDIICVAVFR